jgi:2-dehydropantoate 2-reductase
MRTLVVGAGAVGGYFGGRLAQAGRDVTFLVRAKRAAAMAAKGLEILSPHGNVTLHPITITSNQIGGHYDLLLLGVKSYGLAEAMDDFAAAIGPETTILPVLNGMRHMDVLAARFGQRSVLGGVCLVATEIDDQGRILQLADFQSLVYGELDGQSSSRLAQVDQALQGAGFDASSSGHIVADMWQKWVQLATLGSINCLLRGNIGEVASVSGGAELCLEALKECSDIASACGYPQTAAFLEKQQADLTAQSSSMTSSMYRDFTRGASVEVDTILGDLLERGRRQGLRAPILEAAFVSLSIYQRRLAEAKKGHN